MMSHVNGHPKEERPKLVALMVEPLVPNISDPITRKALTKFVTRVCGPYQPEPPQGPRYA